MNKSRILVCTILLLAACTCFIFCAAAEGVLAFEQVSYTVAMGKTLNVKPVQQGISEYLTFTWTSEDETIAKVSGYGNVTPVGNGTTTITCVGKTKDGTEYSASYAVSVFVPVQRITADKSSVTLSALRYEELDKISEEAREFFAYTPELTFTPEDATYKTIKWESSNPNAVNVDQNGRITVTGDFIGNFTVTGKATDGSNASVRINVTVPAVMTTSPKLVISEPSGGAIGVVFNKFSFFTYGMPENPYAIQGKLDYKDGIQWFHVEPLKAGQTFLGVAENGYLVLQVPVIVEHSAVYDNVSFPPKTVDQILRNPDAVMDTQTQFQVQVIDTMEIENQKGQLLYVGSLQSGSNTAYVGFIAGKKDSEIGKDAKLFGTIAEIREYTSPTGLKYQMPVLKDVHLEG